MWISEKMQGRDSDFCSAAVGLVTVGGAKPSVLVEGEIRNADLASSGAVRLPKTGDEVLLIRSADGESVAVGKICGTLPAEVENGEVYITNGGEGLIRLKNNGEIELVGTVIIKGTAKIEGSLLLNGEVYSQVT